ncbi:RagB/SusD family nutrient uptake outer membrane protein [Flavitalea antarctica]
MNNIFALVLVAMIGFGCNKKLDVKPQQNITPEQITTSDDVKAVLFGAYSLLQGPNAYGERYYLAADLLANPGHVLFAGTFIDYRDLTRKTQISTNALATGMWANSYSIINIANTVIDKAGLVAEDERDEIVAEAKFIRGIVYFELVKYFGLPYSDGKATTNLAVPLVLEPVYGYDASKHNPSRATVDAVYKQVLADLTAAAADLPEIGETARAGKYSALAFLSRVHLSMLNYSGAATAANEVILSDEFGLNVNFSGAFNNANNTVEDIFAIQQTSQSNSGTNNNGMNTFYAAYTLAPPLISGRGDVQVSTAYPGLFGLTDVRGDFFYEGANIAGVSGIYTGKYQQFYKALPVVRFSEMFLTRGEANYRLAGAPIGGVSPLTDINTVRDRAGASPLLTITSADAFVDERFRELGFEGDRLWTLKRTRKSLTTNNVTYTYDHPKLVLPIPQRETDVNKNLVQNPTY